MSSFIFCVDSDGCAIDTMTYKHELFFGPIAAEKYGVEDKETFQKNWKISIFIQKLEVLTGLWD